MHYNDVAPLLHNHDVTNVTLLHMHARVLGNHGLISLQRMPFVVEESGKESPL